MNKEVKVERATGKLNTFIVEPFIKHEQSDEYYLCIQNKREGDEILFFHEGGIEVGDVDSKAERYLVPINEKIDTKSVLDLISKVPKERQEKLQNFIISLHDLYQKLYFCYLEINPLVFTEDMIIPLDMAAKVDQTAEYIPYVSQRWDCDDYITFPPPYGATKSKEEEYISEMDSKTGASLKLTLLNPNGRVWTMVAGGGAR
jgi:ATP citrate (pro-S)-lyase